MAEYKGATSEANRQNVLEKARQTMLDEFQKQKEKIVKDMDVRPEFVAQFDSVEDQLKKDALGLMKLSDYRSMRQSLEKRQAEQRPKSSEQNKKRRKKEKRELLSFDPESDDEEEEDDHDRTEGGNVGKNPSVDTSFLPDREREDRERRERESLKQEWLDKQDALKNEVIQVTYSFWDGSGHRKCVECKKGDTIGQFLEKVRQQWHDLRGVSTDNLIYVKEDLIIPQHYSFYDFIVNKVRGKSGPLFSFDVHDDVRLVNDANVEKQDSHAGKVCERGWYEKNKHIFPASRWEVFDPDKDYGKYSIK